MIRDLTGDLTGDVMAHFMGTIQGNRGAISRLGSKRSGMKTTANGWTLGVTVIMRHNKETGLDEATISITGGSLRGSQSVHVGKFTKEDL